MSIQASFASIWQDLTDFNEHSVRAFISFKSFQCQIVFHTFFFCFICVSIVSVGGPRFLTFFGVQAKEGGATVTAVQRTNAARFLVKDFWLFSKLVMV